MMMATGGCKLFNGVPISGDDVRYQHVLDAQDLVLDIQLHLLQAPQLQLVAPSGAFELPGRPELEAFFNEQNHRDVEEYRADMLSEAPGPGTW